MQLRYEESEVIYEEVINTSTEKKNNAIHLKTRKYGKV